MTDEEEWEMDYSNIELAIKQYADEDDDEESPLGAAIFFSKLGFTVEDVLDSADDEDGAAQKLASI